MQRTQATWSRFAWRASLVAVFLCLIVALTPARRHAEAAPTGSITMSPSNIYLNVGDAVAITVIMNSGVNIHEVNLALAYDPAVVQVVDAQASQPGVQVLQGPFPATSGSGTTLQNAAAAGLIAYQYVLPGSEMDEGFGTIFTVQFIALAEGDAGLSWQTTQVVDASGVPSNLAGTAAALTVGSATPTPGLTNTPTTTSTPTSTPVVAATETPTVGATATPEATGTSEATETAVATVTVTVTPATTTTPKVTPTAKITVIENTNQGKPPQSGVDPAQSDRAGGLPSAGIATKSIAWWRWVFFLAALMFGVAGWFFTLAVHTNSKEVVLIDRFDKRRRRK